MENGLIMGDGHSCCLAYDDFEQIGRLIMAQLAELRHRGAFSVVSQTFAACCMHCSKSDDAHARDLPQKWYKVVYI